MTNSFRIYLIFNKRKVKSCVQLVDLMIVSFLRYCFDIHDNQGRNNLNNQRNCSFFIAFFSWNIFNDNNIANLVVDNALPEEIVEILATGFPLLFKLNQLNKIFRNSQLKVFY